MANDLNRVMLVGRLTRDPELRQTGAGTSYVRFSIANNRNYTSNGERREEVSYFNCVAWARQAEIINEYCRKGKQVAIDGRLQQRSWEGQDGKKQSSVDVVVDNLQLLGARMEGGGGGGGDSYAPAYGGGAPQGGYNQQGGGGGNYGGGAPQGGGNFSEPPGNFDDDDIPF